MKFTYLYTLVLFVVVTTQAQNNKKWTLQECIAHAVQNNISVKTTQLDTETADINIRGAKGAFLPTLNANAGHTWNIGLNPNITTGLLENQTTQFTNASVSSNVTLFNGLQNQNRLRRANLSQIAAIYQVEKIQQDIALNVANAYLQILFNKENVKIQQQQLAVNELQLKRQQQLVKGGRIPEGDLLNSIATIATNKQQLIAAENNLYISKLSLAQLLVLDNPTTFDVSENVPLIESSDILQQTPSAIFEKAKTERIEIKIANNSIDLAQKDIQIAKGAISPILSGSYGFNSRISSLDPRSFSEQFDYFKGHNFGLNLSIPVFNGFATKNNIDRSKIALEKAKLNAQQQTLNLEQTIHTAYADTQAALKTYEAAQDTQKARVQAMQYTTERYEVGMVNSFELNQAQTLVANADADTIKAKYDYLFRMKILELYFGVQLF